MDPSHLELGRDGATFVRGAFDASGMVDTLWGVLGRRYRIHREEPSTWPLGVFGKLTKFGKSGPLASVGSDIVRDAITRELGCGWHETERWGQPLITFPTPGPWSVPGNGWHIDYPSTTPMPAIRLFAFLSTVEPQGGGTVVVIGSHRLVANECAGMRSAAVRARLAARSEWFRDLWRPVPGEDRCARFMHEGATVDDVDVRVVELTGEPGDLVLWHPSLFHGIAPNCHATPRFMLTHTAYRGAAGG